MGCQVSADVAPIASQPAGKAILLDQPSHDKDPAFAVQPVGTMMAGHNQHHTSGKFMVTGHPACNSSRNLVALTALAKGLPSVPLLREDRDGIRFLQQALIETGHMVAGAIRYASGNYGQFTSRAVSDIQSSLRVPATGEYDAAVRAQLLKELNALLDSLKDSVRGSNPSPMLARVGAPSDVSATLNYTDCANPQGASVPQTVLVRDARPLQQDGSLSLDRNGFSIVKQETMLTKEDFYKGRGLMDSVYYQEMQELIQQELGADKVFVLASQVRNSDKVKEMNPTEKNAFEKRTPSAQDTGGHEFAPVQVSSYASKVHTDFTGAKSAEKFYRTAGIPEGVKVRYVLINTWRNMSDEPVYNNPLACLDTTSITNNEMVRVNEIIEAKPGARCNFRDGMTTTDCAEQYRLIADRAKEHRWFYYPHMRKDEVLLFKQFDSDPSRTSRFTFHSSFNDPSVPCALPQRESVEVRAMAIFIEEDSHVKARVMKNLALHSQPAYSLQGRLAARAARGLLAPADVEKWADKAALEDLSDDFVLQQLRRQTIRGGSNTQGLPAGRLSRGTRGEEVRQLQLVLVELGILDYSVIRYDSGSYDANTAAGVAVIQKALGKATNGVYDDAVRGHLQQMLQAVAAA